MSNNINYNLSGPVMWAKLREDNRDVGEYAPEGGLYSIEVGVGPEEQKMILGWSHLYRPIEYKEYPDLRFFRFKRQHIKRTKDGEIIEEWSGPPRVVSKDGEPMQENIGNGSLCTVKVNVNKVGTKTFMRLEAVRVDELIEYGGEPQDDLPF